MPLENLEKEAGNLSFDQVKSKAQESWNKELNKIIIKGSDPEKTNFYTAMYHTFINPTTYMDVNGEYKGLDQNIHKASGFTNYTTFSCGIPIVPCIHSSISYNLSGIMIW
jgi:putative alpha-1,2-mannosidase